MAAVMEGPEAAPEVVPDAALDDVHERLRRFRPVPTVDAEPWELGVDGGWLMQLTRHWAEDYDWRSREDEIRGRPWVLLEGDVPMRLLHYRVGDDAPTVLLLHGWPDSVLRFDRVVPLLSDCNLIIPALPGFPFAAAVASGGLRARDIGAAVGAAVAALGYRDYVVSAGDVGTDVAEGLLEAHGDAVSALHFTDISQYHFLHGLPSDLTQEEQRYVERGHAWQAAEGGYMHEQGTKPATIAAALGDSPAGLAAWIGEKLRSWTDCDGDPFTVFTPDEAVTWIAAYWHTASIGTSFTPYAVASPKPTGRVERPTVFTVFPRDLVNAPRSFADRFFDVRDFRTLERGGPFAAWEQPSDYVGGVRSALAYAD
ncbi:MAG: epoxide hydrolase family protein [Leifsonia sp.]|uniref:epoxide hydrolase family protein n=1 Tax=Leifsonia sp. TaxID=1870902 RepID=UPI003F7F288A